MTMEYPRMLYRVGTMVALESGSYDYKIVRQEDSEQAFADGWHLDQYAAKAAHEKPIQALEASPNPFDSEPDDSPPTREELEQKGKELGLKFDGRTSDKKLAAMIEEKLKV